jgi:L-ascorbate metabolism protein UlaG (beta-lactamase superfamily)
MNQQLTRFYDRFGAGNGLFYPGHASALVVLNGKKILFDPIVISQPYDDAWVFYPPQIVDPRWYEVDAVVVSHIHQDHYDLKFLSKLGPQVKVMIVGQRPVFEKDIQQKSGREITILQPDTVNEIFPNVYLYAINHESNGIDSSAIVYNDDFCVYHGNDNYLQPESMRRFTQVRPHIDVACIPYAYIHWYPFLMEYDEADLAHKDAERARLVNYYMDDCLNNAEILNADVVIPFGANLLIDDGNMRSEINMAVQTPVEFTDYARSQRPDIGARVQPMLAGDFYGVGPDGPELEIARGLRLLIEVDCLDYRARRAEQVNTARAYHHFKLDQVASADWLNGKRFEEVIGMRRFTVKRVPNLYLPNLLRLINTVF